MSETIAEDRDTVTRRALRGDRPVLVRAIRDEVARDPEAHAEAVTRLRYGVAIGEALDVPGVARVLAVEDGTATGEGGFAVVIEGDRARTLRALLAEGRLEITEAVRVASEVARTLGAVHARHVVHHGLEPRAVLVDAETGEVRLTSFEHASRLDREEPALRGPDRGGRAVAYLAPEQTGHANRAVDYRADFFALGVLLYEMLTGRVPFERDGAHVLEPTPIAPQVLRSSVPSALSEVVLKLLAPNAEDRYQSADGVVSDLSECLGHLVEGITLADFQLGKNDLTTSFLLPQRLYGRLAERDHLVGALGRAARGRAEVVLVHGPSGAGKTTLVNELRAACAREQVAFCSGAGDPVRKIPYGALSEAMRELVAEVAAAGDARAAAAGRRLEAAVGPGLAAIVEVIPAVAQLVGAREPPSALGPAEARDRFDVAFQETMGALATRETPLVLFLDDLAWVDAASLRMLEILLRDPEARYLLVVAALDDGEPLPARVAATLTTLRGGPAPVHDLHVGALPAREVEAFVRDALGPGMEAPARTLATYVARATGGNALHLHQLLASLHARGHLKAEPGSGVWRCDVAALPTNGDGALGPEALFAARIDALGAAARTLAVAACFGRRFDLATVARASKRPRREVAADLWAAVLGGIVHPIGAAYRAAVTEPPGDLGYAFVHATARSAALARVPVVDRAALRALAVRTRLDEEGAPDAALFEIAELLVGSPTDGDGAAIARIQLRAGELARRCNATEAAARYVEDGLARLPGGGVETGDPLARALLRERAICAHLEGRIAAAEADLDRLRAGTASADHATIDALHLRLAVGRSDFADAVRLGCAALARHGILLPEGESASAALARETQAVGDALANRPVESLLSAPVTSDPLERTVVELLAHTLLAAAQIDLDRFRLASALIVGRALRHGVAPYSSLGFAAYGVAEPPRGDRGAALSRIALPLAERLDGPGTRAAVQSFGAIFVSPLCAPLVESLAPLEQAHASALAAGDLRLAGLTAVQRLLIGLMSGEDLYLLEDRATRYRALLRRLGRSVSAALAASIERTLLHFTRGAAPASTPLSQRGLSSLPPTSLAWGRPPVTDEHPDEIEPPARPAGDAAAFASHWVISLQRAFLFGERRRAVELGAEAAHRLDSVRGHLIEAEHRFYYGLALAADDAGDRDDEARAKRLDAVTSHRDRLATWAQGSPAGFRHRHLLLAAEAARLEGDASRAIDLYDGAIEAAEQNGHPGIEALAAEVAARFHAAAGRRHVARAYLLHAREAYARWGADAKAADLRRRHRDLLPEAATAAPASAASGELAGILRSAREIAGELRLPELGALLLRTALELSAAERAVLVPFGPAGVEPLVEARASADTEARIIRAGVPLDARDDLAVSLVRWVAETRDGIVLEHAAAEGPFRSDPYVLRARPRSLLGLPLVHRERLVGVLYLENNLAAGAFPRATCASLEIIAAHAAVALDNARAHGELAARTAAQNEDLARSHADLASALLRVKDAQKRLLVQEKLATLGGLTAGIAHEIKNPLNFINNFAESSVGIADELREELVALRSQVEAQDLAICDELLAELRGNAGKINEHGRRADEIVRSMLEHSRVGNATARAVDLNALLREYVKLAYQGFRSHESGFNVAIDASYAQELPPMSIVPQDMARVFLNLVNNACYAVHAKKKLVGRGFAPALRVSTRDLGHAVQIRIRDNGTGIPRDVKERIFQPFFTTKPTGDGTGLGLSISADIVATQGGTLEVETEEGEFTEFIVTLPTSGGAAAR
jgi:predicted ATPase/signal transduction histidine kinase